MFRCYFFLIFIRLWKFVRMECCCNGKMRQNVSVCVCVFGSIVSALLLLVSSIFYNKEAHQKRPLYWSVCTLLWRLKFPLAEKSQQTMIWTMLFFASFCIALLCSVLNSNAREVNGSYIFLIVLVLDEFWVTNSCRETWLPKWWYDGNKDECDTYVTSASRSLSISLFLYKFRTAHPGICFWSVLFLVLKTRPHITKSRCWMLNSIPQCYHNVMVLIYMHMHRDVCVRKSVHFDTLVWSSFLFVDSLISYVDGVYYFSEMRAVCHIIIWNFPILHFSCVHVMGFI